MITATSEEERFRVRFTDGAHEGLVDAARADGGSEAGFKPNALIEAALASCIAITVRMYAERHGLALPGLATRAKLDLTQTDQPVLRYDIDFAGAAVSEDMRARLFRAAKACPVHKLLARPVAVERAELVV
jgi:putative redox protein